MGGEKGGKSRRTAPCKGVGKGRKGYEKYRIGEAKKAGKRALRHRAKMPLGVGPVCRPGRAFSLGPKWDFWYSDGSADFYEAL